MLHRITPGIVLVFLLGMVALCLSLFFYRQAGRSRRLGDPFEQKATAAFFTLLLAVVLFLGSLFLLALQLPH
ncbi:hypothetical protein [Taibaiella koreensis]|uniref:hypothetical protein n=1 Tax=Taibaiella koreensis TaxID=1268548 RepID=UPI000E5A0B07|nr:hypothetical protein [Taibaiella koreensis]